MRGKDQQSDSLFSYIRLETRIPADHPLRPIRKLVDEGLLELSPAFSKLYAREGRPSIPPERLLRALLLQALYTVRSERLLMEQLEYNLLFRWFVGLSMDDVVWDATVFCKNRDRLLDGDIARKFMTSVLNLPQVRGLLSSEHFSVDGTLIEAWASMKSFVPKVVTRRHREVEQAVADATPSATFMARNARMTRTSRQPIRMRGCSARAPEKRQSSVTWAI
jgi:transposase